jgi:hypothetical protein
MASRRAFCSLLIIVACARCAGSVPSAATEEPPATRTPVAPSVTPPAVSSPSPAEPSATPIVWTAAERAILAGIRTDARVACTPVGANLPRGAVAGVECRPDTDLVARVGFYRFASEREMLTEYYARFAQYGVARDSWKLEIGSDGRDCWRGVPVEGSYLPGGSEGIPNRSGCFLNEYEIANTRTLWVRHLIYIGVLGKNQDIARLYAWAWGDDLDPRGGPTLWLAPA